MPPFTSTGYARGKYLPGGRRKKTASRYGKKTKSLVSKSNIANVYATVLKNQLQVYRYPFSIATKYPKIPDGKVGVSIGLPFNYSRNVKVPVDYTDVWFVLYPGITGCVSVLASKRAGGVISDITTLSTAHFIQHCLPFYHVDTEKAKIDYSLCGYSSYRYISCGLRIGVDDGHLKNGGFFEANRIPINRASDLVGLNRVFDTEEFNVLAVNHRILKINNSSPDYQTDTLKTLGHYEFRLKDCVDEHDFVKIPEVVEFNEALVSTSGFETSINDGKDSRHLFDYLADAQFDAIVVRCEIKNPAVASGFSYHCAANIELQPNIRGNFNHFVTDTISAEKMFKKVKGDVERYYRYPGVVRKNLYTKTK